MIDLGKIAFTPKGEFESLVEYEKLDIVNYLGCSWASCINNNQGNIPVEGKYWTLVAAKGDKGDKMLFSELTESEKEEIKGKPGTPAPSIEIDKESKHWLLGGIDQGVVAEGKDGVSPVITENEGNTEKIYKLDIEDKSGKRSTPNLRGLDGEKYVIPTLESVPDENVLSYTVEGITKSFDIGYMARVFDTEKEEYVFYQLYDITEAGTAIWKKAGSGGDMVLNETLVITLTTNQSQPDPVLNGLIVHVKYGDNDTQLTWQGSALTTTIPMNMTYTVELPEIEGYNTPTTEDYIALAGNTRDLTLSYNATVLTVALSGNQSQPDTSLNGTVVTISYGSKTKQLTWQGSAQTIKVPTGQQITISGASVEGYSKPANDVRTPEGTTDSVTLLYNTTITSVSLTSNQVQPDTKLNGIKISVQYGSETKQLTWQGSTLSIKIPTGSTYTVTPANISGYNTPAAKQGTASGATGNVSLSYTTEKVTINVTADDGASVSGQTLTVTNTDNGSQLYSGAAGSGIVLYLPFNTHYKVSVNAMSAYHPVSDQLFTAGAPTRTVTVTYGRIKTSRIVQDDSIVDPENISGDVNGTIIQQNRAKIRRCLAKKSADGQMTIRYLRNDNSNYYDDGSAAKLDGTEGDVMVYFPTFYYKYENLGSYKFAYSFALVQLDSTWKKSSEFLLGAYEAYVTSNKVYSRSGVASSGNVSTDNFKSYARTRGTGYQIIDYDMHKMIAWLFYSIYGTRHCQSVCGSGTNDYQKATGQTNTIGNVDTTTANGNSMSINFLGIENCWGNKYEWLDNVVVNPSSANGVWRVTDTVAGTTRDIPGMTPNNSWNWPKTVVAGEYLDIVVKEAGQSETTGYSDGQYLSTSTSGVVARSCYSSYSNGGVAFANCVYASSFSSSFYGSRLAFRGVVREAESVSAFKSITISN